MAVVLQTPGFITDTPPRASCVLQALEDAYVLTTILQAVNNTAQIPEALQSFYKKRIVRTTIVQFLSRLASDLIINVRGPSRHTLYIPRPLFFSVSICSVAFVSWPVQIVL